MLDRRYLGKICGILLLLTVLLILPQFCTGQHHGHSHDHHGHSHDHHGHSHGHAHESPSFKYSKEANQPPPKAKEQDHHGHSHGNNHGHSHGNNHGHSHEKNHGHSHGKQQSIPSKEKLVTPNRATFTLWAEAIIATLLISVAPFVVLFFIPIDNSPEKKPLLKVLLSFASGGLLGDAFLHLIPHALMAQSEKDEQKHTHSHGHSHENGESHVHDMSVGLWVLTGIVAFLMVEKFVRIVKGSHGHSHGGSHSKPVEAKEKTASTSQGKKEDNKSKQKSAGESKNAKGKGEIKVAGYLNLAADFTHNFTDGLAIGASFLAGRPVGIITTITVLLHEVPHEIGDFAILIQSGCDRKKAIFLQLTTALGALSGCCASLLAEGIGSAATAWILPFTAGGFIYIATVSVIPELLENSKFTQSFMEIIALVFGVGMMYLIAYFE